MNICHSWKNNFLKHFIPDFLWKSVTKPAKYVFSFKKLILASLPSNTNQHLALFQLKSWKATLSVSATSILELKPCDEKVHLNFSFSLLPQSFSRHLIFYSSVARNSERETVESVVECDFRKIKHLSYFRSYHWRWQKCDKREYFHRMVLKQKRHLPHCCCSFNMYLKLINFSKTCSREERRTLWRRLLLSDSNFTPLKLSVSRNEPTPDCSTVRYVGTINWIQIVGSFRQAAGRWWKKSGEFMGKLSSELWEL